MDIKPEELDLTLPELTVRLPEIKSITLYTPPSSFILPSSFATLRSFAHLTILDLTANFLKFSHFTEIVSAFPKLEDLRVRIEFENPASWDISHRPSAHLHSLRVIWPTREILQWLLSLYPVPAIPNLDLHISLNGDSDIPFIAKYFRSVGDKLKTFTLACHSEDGLESDSDAHFSKHVYRDLNLSVNTTLQSMTVDAESVSTTFIECLVSQLNSPDFRELKFNNFYSGDEWHSVDRRLSEILSLRQFMIICSFLDPEASEEKVRAAFPRCNDRGILDVQCQEDDDDSLIFEYAVCRNYSLQL
ncbi:hypothetical protein BDQ12DRAFT_727486 [Crucibulum laeve]|uniref:F-box domain-containing protein n=1 Tax=Crucibulum laeve TaxID=68775 RepID=A0A5C3LP24_9AGAR|nr:hypothetical protein BDQ12DRAFT_727486 [Crucibulum laeve]